jgi:probable selenium-dependent hydroxylase accessory protein YqeC
MASGAGRLDEVLMQWFPAGAIYTFVGAGGKTTAMKRVASVLEKQGIRVRLTTTTRLGSDEFDPRVVRTVPDRAAWREALQGVEPLLVLAGGRSPDGAKLTSVDPAWLEDPAPSADTVVLVEGDGSRGLPMKAPTDREPVIPSSSAAVFAVMGIRAFDEPVNQRYCYNHQKALDLLGRADGRFEPPEIAALAAHPDGFRKGVTVGMGYRVLLNQGDLQAKRPTAREALALLRDQGVWGALVSFEEGVVYEPAEA